MKNAYVSGGITGFAAIAAIAAACPAINLRTLCDLAVGHALATGAAAALLAARVFADAILCDLDDAAADSAHGTSTLPVRLGRPIAWNVATSIRLTSAIALAALPQLPFAARISWAIVTAISSVLPRILKPARMRDWIDARLPLEAVAVSRHPCDSSGQRPITRATASLERATARRAPRTNRRPRSTGSSQTPTNTA